jgi:short-subunit dehydrogenase
MKELADSLFIGPVSVLVNAAGASTAAEFEDTDINEFERLLHMNYLSAVYATRAVIKGRLHPIAVYILP